MKSSTVRFADAVYRELEAASRLTGLPINSIVTVACLEWLQRNLPLGMQAPTGRWAPMTARELHGLGVQSVRLAAATEAEAAPGAEGEASDPLWVFTAAAREALGRAQDDAERSRQPWIGTVHLLQGLTEVAEGRAALALRRLGAEAVELERMEPEETPEPPDRRLPTRQVRRAMRRAQEEAEREGAAQIGTDHLLLGLLLDPDGRVAAALEAAGVKEPALRRVLGDLAPER
jgi:hypothetical protein